MRSGVRLRDRAEQPIRRSCRYSPRGIWCRRLLSNLFLFIVSGLWRPPDVDSLWCSIDADGHLYSLAYIRAILPYSCLVSVLSAFGRHDNHPLRSFSHFARTEPTELQLARPVNPFA